MIRNEKWRTKGWLKAMIVPAVLTPSLAFAGTHIDRARVVEVEPIYHTVEYAVPREQCRIVDVPYDRHRGHRSTAAPVIGAIIGGAIGNAVGHKKSNKRVGTAVGAILGGSIGYDMSRRNAAHRDRVSYRSEEVCEVVDEYRTEEKLSGYDVTYRYGGQTYTTRMSTRPGSSIPVRVSVSPA